MRCVEVEALFYFCVGREEDVGPADGEDEELEHCAHRMIVAFKSVVD